MVENKLNIQSKAFLTILEEEGRLRALKNQYPMGSVMWNAVWDKLDKVLKRKKAYEAAVLRGRGR